MTTYTTINDYLAQVVNPALGEYADDYDTEEIARDMTEWHDEKDANGNILLNASGLVERDDADFWEIAQKHEI